MNTSMVVSCDLDLYPMPTASYSNLT